MCVCVCVCVWKYVLQFSLQVLDTRFSVSYYSSYKRAEYGRYNQRKQTKIH